jgi:RHS repeat-associated protein
MAQENPYLNTTDITETKLDFTGKVLESRTNHTKDSNAAIVTLDQFEYDPMGRLLVHNQTIDGLTTTIASNTYDQTGQLLKKSVGGEVTNTLSDLKDLVNVAISGNEITSTNSSNSWSNGFATIEQIDEDGYIQWRASSTNKGVMVGLSSNNTDASYTSIDYALYNRYDGTIRVYENGNEIGTFGTYQAGDLFRVERTGSSIEYLHNGRVIYTSTVSSSGSLLGDASFYSPSTRIEDLIFRNANAAALQVVDYDYNIRGWLREINDVSTIGTDLFAFGINYNDPSIGTPLFNGNISQTVWKTLNADSSTKFYTYSYDALNRIQSASDNTSKFNLVDVDYDKNGNITALVRKGAIVANPMLSNAQDYGTMDNLTYSYQNNSNKLMKVSDELTNDMYGFKDDAVNFMTDGADDYSYDGNGNMISDANKGITSITYNHLNLPTLVSIGSDDIEYIYDAMGTKLKKIVTQNSVETRTAYAGNYIYEGGNLAFFSQPEGYVTPDGMGGYDYVYQYKDHLGNVRLSYSDSDGSGYINDSGIFNDGFESASGWNTGGTLTEYDSTFKMSGAYSGKIVKSTAGEKFVQSDTWTTIDNSAATDYTFSGWVFSDGPTADIFLFMKTESEAGYFTQVSSVRSTSTGQWEYLEKTFSVPSNIKKLNIRIDNNGGGTVWFDDIKIKLSGSEIVEENNYYPFGLEHKGYNNDVSSLGNSTAQRWKFGGKELDESLDLDTYDFGARNYDPALGRWMNVDPLAEETMQPYSAFNNNPVFYTDPTGMIAEPFDEYDQDGNKISNLGGDQIDFYHQENGDTKVVDRESGESNVIRGGEALIRGYEHRDSETDWKTIYDEWKTGTGPENSLMYGADQQMNEGLFASYQVNQATEKFNKAGGDKKTYYEGSFGIFGYLRATTNMTEQMVGKAGVSIYPLGDDLRMIMIADSKSISSWTWNWMDGDEVNTSRIPNQTIPQSTTRQTYIFTVSDKQLQRQLYQYNTLHDSDW